MISFRNILLEGGNAVTNVSRINQENSHATLEKVYSVICPLLKIKKEDLVLLGSATKKEPGDTSGDIDMALSTQAVIENNNISEDLVLSFISKQIDSKLKYENAILKGFKIVSVAFPIVNKDGKQPNQLVQLDLMLSDNLQYSVFGYHAPTKEQSKYKGVHRNILISAILRHFGYKVLKKDASGNAIEWESFNWSPDVGLQKVVKRNKVDKNGKLLKGIDTIKRDLITKDPATFVHKVFGSKFKPEDINSFESVLNIINSKDFIGKAHKKDIIDSAKEFFKINTKIEFPKELK